MDRKPTLTGICFLSLLALSGCDRHQDQLTPAAQTEEGRQKAQDYPSTRNTENPDPSTGGMNRATSESAGHASDLPSTAAADRAPEDKSSK